ncbi:excalibur calcium-binding domain-containing protein [Oerskovia merdavium]|uniref:Excalibur calcium-binding domain-containing protein n=1 Tax=Oerskovia merdavium TaxID=2762227 RepID=A0ABR8TZV6_9CELL|nr:excalibur calcium-binding domain-containing protein [Oerskovia merdavium]MBD7981294.1 excalibur calcium-binding domain-containing protein [Oerskovia merdavium]
MAVHFNPPPGWLVPPGFAPSSDWHPDPAWPAAPQGWVFWVEAGAAAAVPTPPPPPAPPASGAEAWSRETPGGGIPVLFQTAGAPGASAVSGATNAVPAGMHPGTLPATSPGGGTPAVGPTRRSRRDVSAPAPAEAPSSTMILPVVGAAAAPGGAATSTAQAGGPAVPVAMPAVSAGQPPASDRGPLAIFSSDDDEEREERTYMRWLLPLGIGVGCLAVGLLIGLGVTLKAQSEAGDATAAAALTTEQMAAEREKLDAERTDLETQLAGIAASTEAVTARETAAATKEAELDARDVALDDREVAIAEREAAVQDNNNGNDGGWDSGKVNGIYLTCEAAKREGKTPLKQGDDGFNPALDWDGNGVACER